LAVVWYSNGGFVSIAFEEMERFDTVFAEQFYAKVADAQGF